jgi:acyl carrier protein
MNNQVKESEFLVKLRELIADVLDVNGELLTDQDTKFVDDLGVDSLMALELMVTLEREYKLKLTEEDLRQMTCLRDVHDLLLNRLNSDEFSNGRRQL